MYTTSQYRDSFSKTLKSTCKASEYILLRQVFVYYLPQNNERIDSLHSDDEGPLLETLNFIAQIVN